jgi:uncharacterized damage-inducible protein DinB
MKPTEQNAAAIQAFLDAYNPQRNIIRDFYEALPEKEYDFLLANKNGTKSDTPRQSLAHILEYRLLVLESIKTGKFEYKSMGVEDYYTSSKEYLLQEWDKHEKEFVEYCTSPDFDTSKRVEMPWGSSLNAEETLYLIRDHEILHVGWNLAFMDVLNIPRFQSMIDAWG